MIGYAFVNNNIIEDVRQTLPNNWRNISNFYIHKNNFEYLNTLGWYKVEEEIPNYNPATQKLDNWSYKLDNGIVKKIPEVINIPQPSQQDLNIQAQQIKVEKWQEIRNYRDELMKQFEWRYNRLQREIRLGLNTTDDIKKLDDYMQALADITLQNDPFSIVWPEFVIT